MGYNLTIDQGNSAAKVALWHDDDMVNTMRYDVFDADVIEEIAKRYELGSVILSSVSIIDPVVLSALENVCKKVYILSHKTALPIVNDYASPLTLGCDRIAAAVGAWTLSKERPLLVVDLGTAVTYDVVTAQGHYIGGNIAPGLKMRLEALHNFTAKLPKVDADGECPLWGVNTETAIRAGAINGIVGELTYYRSKLADDAIVVCTGGDADVISKLLDFEVIIEPNLVNIGLNSILLYNEDK